MRGDGDGDGDGDGEGDDFVGILSWDGDVNRRQFSLALSQKAQASLTAQNILLGHSCKIGNVPIVEAKNIFFMFPVLWWYFWYQFVFTKMEKVKGQLKNISGEFLGQDLKFLCPHVTLPFQSFFSFSGRDL